MDNQNDSNLLSFAQTLRLVFFHALFHVNTAVHIFEDKLAMIKSLSITETFYAKSTPPKERE